MFWSTSSLSPIVLKNNQIINPNCHTPSILIFIPSFDSKHTINVIVYIGFDVYAQFQRREREECQGVYLEEDNVPILKAVRMKTEEDKMYNLENIRSKCFLIIYKGIFVN